MTRYLKDRNFNMVYRIIWHGRGIYYVVPIEIVYSSLYPMNYIPLYKLAWGCHWTCGPNLLQPPFNPLKA
jgi:hypothetical protein